MWKPGASCTPRRHSTVRARRTARERAARCAYGARAWRAVAGRVAHEAAGVCLQGDDKGFRAKISDFGLSQHMTKDQHYVLVSKGTEAYLPMEVFKNLALTEKSDVYALGLLMWEIFYGIFWHAIYEKEKQRRQCAPPRVPVKAPVYTRVGSTLCRRMHAERAS